MGALFNAPRLRSYAAAKTRWEVYNSALYFHGDRYYLADSSSNNSALLFHRDRFYSLQRLLMG